MNYPQIIYKIRQYLEKHINNSNSDFNFIKTIKSIKLKHKYLYESDWTSFINVQIVVDEPIYIAYILAHNDLKLFQKMIELNCDYLIDINIEVMN